MCVAHGREALVSRSAFFGVAAAAAAPLALGGEAFAQTADVGRYPLPPAPSGLSAGNARAVRLAQRAPLVHAAFARVAGLAASIQDAPLRASIETFLRAPAPSYARNAPTPEAKLAVRDALARAGFVKPADPVAGIFPPGSDTPNAVQPFWTTPGSSDGSHHAYPGGLAVHEHFNATTALGFAQTYDRLYFGGRPTVERDTIVGAALYHDVMKSVVFQWRDDGTLFDELTIAGTGGHHILSGAQAIADGRTTHFITTLLSAHAAPSLGDEAKVADWCRAAAIVAGVDPVERGLVQRAGDGYRLAAAPAPLEAFINHLSDHDYVLSIHAMHVVGEQLKARFEARRPPGTFAWYRSAILTRTTGIALYDQLARRGDGAFAAAVGRAENEAELF